MNTIKPRRLHPVWDTAVFLWITAVSAGMGIMQRKDVSVWLIILCAAVGISILALICVKFIPAQGCDIFIMTEDSVPKRRICIRFIVEIGTVILAAVIAGALIGFFSVAKSTAPTIRVSGNQGMTGDWSAMDFGDMSDMQGMPEGMGEGSFSFPTGGNTDGGYGDRAGDDSTGDQPTSETMPTEDAPAETSEGQSGAPTDMTPPGNSYGEGTPSSDADGAQSTQRPQNSGNMQSPTSLGIGYASNASSSAGDGVTFFMIMGLLAILFILTAAASLAVSVIRYDPYGEWEWKYEYAD